MTSSRTRRPTAGRDRLEFPGQGLLSGRYDATNRPTGGVRQVNALFLEENLRRAAGLLGVLREIATTHDVTPAQVALAWLS